MKTILVWLIAAILLVIHGGISLAVEELYLIDLRETPGKILEVKNVTWSSHPVLRSVYIRPANSIFAIAFHKYGRAYFVDLNHRDIYATDGFSEEKIFSFDTPIQDLDFDSRGRMYFSAIGDSEGSIYNLNRHTGRTTRIARFSFRAITNETRGFWNGHFAFDQSDRLFLSIDNAHPGGSTLYEYVNGRLTRRFSHVERITGFTFIDDRTIYFTNASTRVYEVRDLSDVSVRHEERSGRMLNDVELVTVPDQGQCTLSGRLSGGSDLWRLTSVQALGPNVVWRTTTSSTIQVSRDGRYQLRGMANGRYRVATDIHGDTMAGFLPRARTVNCGGLINNVNFTYSR